MLLPNYGEFLEFITLLCEAASSSRKRTFKFTELVLDMTFKLTMSTTQEPNLLPELMVTNYVGEVNSLYLLQKLLLDSRIIQVGL